RIVFETSQGDEAPALEFAARRLPGEGLGVGVKGGVGILAQDTLLSPLPKICGCSGIYIVFRIVFVFLPAENDPYQVVGAGCVVAVLHSRSNLVVRLGENLRSRHLLRVITESTEGNNVSHG